MVLASQSPGEILGGHVVISEREQLRQLYQKEDSGEKTFIPAKPKINPNERDRFFRTCAYCRVSTDNDEQLSSFELQQAHYRQLVQDHPNWELKRIFADEGISGTSLKNRDAFNEMIDACRKGEYDLIVTKSVSRNCPNVIRDNYSFIGSTVIAKNIVDYDHS